MSEMVTWLRDAITHRRDTAEAATKGPWIAQISNGYISSFGDERWEMRAPQVDKWVAFEGYNDGGIVREQDAAHIALNDPEDVIARCEAELAILDLHEPIIGDWINYTIAEQNRADDVIRLLASGYRHRPGYQEAWHE